MFDLNGKVVLLTGASGGIGNSIAKKMKKQGAKLILSGTRQNILESLIIYFLWLTSILYFVVILQYQISHLSQSLRHVLELNL